MTGWGGTGKAITWIFQRALVTGTDELPIQVATGARGVNLSTSYGRIWAAEFINDYIAGAVDNLFAADQLYPVTYAQNTISNCSYLTTGTATEKQGTENLHYPQY